MTNIILGPIIGGLSHHQVKLWARADGPSTLYAWIATREDTGDVILGGSTNLDASTGFAGVVVIAELKPETIYYFALSLDPKQKPEIRDYLTFKTFPLPGKRTTFQFAFGSCYRPGEDTEGNAFEHLLANHGEIAFTLLLGDQIYADESDFNGVGHIARDLNEYRAVYQHTWKNKHLRALLKAKPVFMTLDDHEVDNDWRWLDDAHTRSGLPFYTRLNRWLRRRPREEWILSPDRVRAGLQAYWEHQAMHAPAKLLPAGPLAYEFEYGAAAFFVLDTRTQRVVNQAGYSILGEKQWAQLTEWLKRVKDKYPAKFIVVSTSILTRIVLDVTRERWSAFKLERNRLLDLIAIEEVEGVHFLAGDLHAAHSATATIQNSGRSIELKEYCATPFEQDPNHFAWLLTRPIKGGPVQNSELHYVIDEINYGIVSVDFENPSAPKTTFQLNLLRNGEWKTEPPQ